MVDKLVSDCPNINFRIVGLGILNAQLGTLAGHCSYINEPLLQAADKEWSLHVAKNILLPSARSKSQFVVFLPSHS